jgi:hypothetical protein
MQSDEIYGEILRSLSPLRSKASEDVVKVSVEVTVNERE